MTTDAAAPQKMAKVVPASPLPWCVRESNTFQIERDDDGIGILDHGDEFKSRDDAAFVVHAANAYPQLVAALKNIRSHTAEQDAYDLLKSLGEL